MIAIVNYGLGNLGSIQNMLKKAGYPGAVITNSKEALLAAKKIILPGVGAFDNGMQKILDSGLKDVLDVCALEQKKPILGICLGMQLLTKGSEEGTLKGLGWIDAHTLRFNLDDPELKIPHMGWNEISIKKESYLSKDLDKHPRFYFVHSYYVQCNHANDVLMQCHYGTDFTCGVQHKNITGVQFHPEKSHRFGLQLLKNFASN